MISGSENIVVIGGGSTGTSIAYNLAVSGKKVSLIDRGTVASGNTGKSSALIRTHYSNPLIASMSIYSQKIISNFESIGYSGFTKTGMIFPFNEKYSDVAAENVRMLQELGANESVINPEEIKKYFPDSEIDDFGFVAFEPDSGYADPVSTANSFASKAKELGAEILTGKPVESVESDGQGAFLKFKDGRMMRATKIVLATNVWTNDLLERSGISSNKRLPISASLHSVIYLKRPDVYRGIKPTLWDPPNLSYYKMEGETVTALGSLDPEIDAKPIDVHSVIPETAPDEYVEDYVGKIMKRLPGMKDAVPYATVTGLYDMTPDGQAIIDDLSPLGLDNVYVCAGLSGHGFKLSPAYGRIVSDMLNGIDPDSAKFNWKTFSADRFKTGKLIKSRYDEIGTIY